MAGKKHIFHVADTCDTLFIMNNAMNITYTENN